ncbi:hypothetical protein A2160_04530 [Candidatus Beckwithbacteria bacterium RBG_13_42_9]|uniref:Uncharacterized protein n=1 Tax=Candidatus Beckwithbacteria bacterium RBG_13_42_9 TaxID=1797457 RepID=A0A1F5E9D7_9BACT|nr:MAG: hypothetical protein A2160_04530 [Candidatus Beckwithbacteria bacterium RBG_13_42_9]
MAHLTLYNWGNFQDIVVYQNEAGEQVIKLLLLHSLLIIASLTSFFYILNKLASIIKATTIKRLDSNQTIQLTIGIVVSIFIVWVVVRFPSYLIIGDYLRDNLGINIYYMDWVGWGLSMVTFLSSILMALVIKIVDIGNKSR